MTLPDIGALVPHAGPMVLLGRLLEAGDEGVCAEVAIGPGSMFFDGQGVGAWVGIEYMAQAIAAHAGYLAHLRGEPAKVGFLLGARRYLCERASFADGSVLRVHVKQAMQGDNGLAAYECRIEDAGANIATATINVFVPDNVNDYMQRA